ncbi:MAG: hypothetical protein SO085_01940, partial [Eubacteriales bacterium]|nr:hypothetical protein [Eubacteriales bacterium]
MQKYINPVLSIIFGILTFGMYGASFMNLSAEYGFGTPSVGTAYEFIRFDTETASITAFAVLSVILLILAGLMIVSGILLILNNCKVLKINWIEKANAFLMIVSALIAIATMICYVVFYAVDMADLASISTVGPTAITLAVVSIVFAIATTLL